MDEFEILKKFVPNIADDKVFRGAGDDCSLIEYSKLEYLVSGTDCLVEDVHFRRDTYSFADIAYKTLAVNVSDLAAMGATPLWAHLTLAIPSDISDSQIEEFFKTFQSICRNLQIKLVGGDLSASPKGFFVNLHLSGLVKKNRVKLRENLKLGEALCVTGPLGDASAGLYCLENKLSEYEKLKLIQKRPPIELQKGLFLSTQSSVKGMMDLSDGLASDLQRIPQAGFEIHLEKIPMSKELLALADSEGKDPLEWALSGGEDYRLLFSCDEKELPNLQESYKKQFEQEFFVIGRILKNSRGTTWLKENKKVIPNLKTFSHFN